MLEDGDEEVTEKAEKKMRPRAAQRTNDIVKGLLYQNAKKNGWSSEEVARRAKKIDDTWAAGLNTWKTMTTRHDDDTPPHGLLKCQKSKRSKDDDDTPPHGLLKCQKSTRQD